jgi:D-alanyl-D-alanine carboxypeptidase/D-alanyl-D-alanine-endopeptidase (penicillin-binding protein 4)
MTMNEVQMTTVITAEAMPTVLGEKRMGWIIGGQAAPRCGAVDWKTMFRRYAPFRCTVLIALAWAMAAGVALAQTALPPEFTQALARAGVPREAVSVMVTALPAAVPAPVPAVAAGSKRGAVSPPASTVPAPYAAPALPAPRLSHRAEAPMNPASVMKLVTTFAGLDLLGPDFTWTNRVYVDGPVAGGVLDGHLVIRGSGDPKLVLERLDALFRQVIAQGVREVRGDIVLDNAIFQVPERNPADFDDEPLRPYNASPDGLLVNFKSLVFTFTPDAASGRAVIRSEPPIAGVDIQADLALAGGPCGDWRAALRADFSSPQRVHFAGRYPGACGERLWPVAYVQPRAYASRVVQAMWGAAGGTLAGQVREGPTPAGARLWVSAESLPLSSIVADINKFSNNVMAQQLFLTLSAHAPGGGTFEGSRRQLQRWWRDRFGEQAAPVLDNGSGLSREERTSAAALTALLRRAASGPLAAPFTDSLGIAGVDGTVARMRERNGSSPALGNAWLKTGSLRDVAAVAGYVNGRSGQRYSLVALINHDNAQAARPALDQLVDWVARDP